MKNEIYINGELKEATNADMKVLEKYFVIEEENKVFDTNDLDDVYYIKARKIITQSDDMLEFVMFLEANGFDSITRSSSSSPCKIIGVKKDSDYTKEEMAVVVLPWILFYNKNYCDELFVYSLDDMLDMSSQELSTFNWIFDIEWKSNIRRSNDYKLALPQITDLIRRFDIPYTSTTRRKVKVLKTTKRKK